LLAPDCQTAFLASEFFDPTDLDPVALSIAQL